MIRHDIYAYHGNLQLFVLPENQNEISNRQQIFNFNGWRYELAICEIQDNELSASLSSMQLSESSPSAGRSFKAHSLGFSSH